VPPVWPVEANLVLVLVPLPKALDTRLRKAGATYCVRSGANLPKSLERFPFDWNICGVGEIVDTFLGVEALDDVAESIP